MSVSIKLHPRDQAAMESAMADLAHETGKTLREVLPAQMRLLATDLAYVTRPKGKGTGDNKANMAKVIARVRDVYPHPGTIVNLLKKKEPGVAGRFAGLIEKRQYAKAEILLARFLPDLNCGVGAFDGGKLHKAQKDSKRVTRRLCVPAQSRVEAYAKRTARRVGFAKGSFATAARQLGGVRGIPGWATRQKSPGTGSVTGDGKTLAVTMESGVRYLRQALNPHDEAAALRNRARNVGLTLKRIQDRKVRKSMRQMR